MSVQVAVRVRPFNQREIDLNSKLIIDMKGATTILQVLEDPKKDKSFAFDYSFWSHDEFEIDEDGMNRPIGERYADQQAVYETVGKSILDNAWEGYHCCLFAYGQTGAGKSYSMVGYKPNIGIVPIACKEIFKRINLNENDKMEYEVYVSMMEIYNEKIQDLLAPIKSREPGGLKVRENKTIGFYAEGLSKFPVVSYQQIETMMDEGQKNKTIASTQMNASSSRAHTIITIEFKQKEQLMDKKLEKFSVINLVDLAGSEKVGKTGATGDRLKEAGSINKSLSCLGMVISALAEIAGGKKATKVPYRDSALTKILCNALGGNSKTLMICAISPSHDNYDETLSTLRYADQAKKIKNKATVNENETDKKIRELTSENEILKKMIEEFQNKQGYLQKGEFREMEEQFISNSKLVKKMETTYQEQLEENKIQEQVINIDLSLPHLTNLNEDPLLNNKIQYSLDQEFTHIGRKTGEPVPQIILNGMGIKRNHAYIQNKDNKIFIVPIEQECGDYLFVNGEKCFESKQIYHLDRIIFGTESAFLLIIPDSQPRESEHQLIQSQIDWEFAQEELTSKIDKEKQDYEEQQKIEKEKIEKAYKQTMENFEKQKQELEEKFMKEQQQLKQVQERQQAETEMKQQMAKLEALRAQKELERERDKKRIQDEESMKKYKIKEKHYLEHKLSKYLPKILEVNLIAKELKKNISLSAKLAYYYQDTYKFGEDQSKKLKIQIQVNNREDGTIYLWDLGKFSNRYYIIKDLLDRYFETNEIPVLTENEDPFWDPPEPLLIGYGFLKLLGLAYLMDTPNDLILVGDNGACGTLKVNLIPTDETGTKNLGKEMDEEGEIIDDPQELLNTRLDFLVIIESAKLPANFCTDTYIEYSLLTENNTTATFTTEKVMSRNPNPVYNYKYHHCYEKVTPELINYLQNNTLCFKVFGFEEIKQMNIEKQLNQVQESSNSGEEDTNPIDNSLNQGNMEKDEIVAKNNAMKKNENQILPPSLQIETPQKPPQQKEEEPSKLTEKQLKELKEKQAKEEKERARRESKTKDKDKDCIIF